MTRPPPKHARGLRALEFYDKQGNLVELAEWFALMSDPDYQNVAQHHVRGWGISTDWLTGADTSFGEAAEPLIFETMIFDPLGMPRFCARYPTVDDAVLGHSVALTALLDKLGTGLDEVWPPVVRALPRGNT